MQYNPREGCSQTSTSKNDVPAPGSFPLSGLPPSAKSAIRTLNHLDSMASFSSDFIVGSTSSAQSVRDVIASYRRAQYFVAESTVPALEDTEVDEEAAIEGIQDDDSDETDDITTPKAGDEFQFQLDEEAAESQAAARRLQPAPYSGRVRSQRQPLGGQERSLMCGSQPIYAPTEDTPLLRKAISFSTPTLPPRRTSISNPLMKSDTSRDASKQNWSQTSNGTSLLRRSSVTSTKAPPAYSGRSTFGQTLFNSIAILLGIGMLSEPLAFAYTGWGLGTALIISYGFVSCYTAKILSKIILSDPKLRSYSDIGRKAFGPRSTTFISAMFCLELFAVSVVLVTLYGDSLHTIIPKYSSNDYKLWGLIILLPTVFLPLSLLSYASILGILSTILMVVVILIDGISKRQAPGSLWEPAETSWGLGSNQQVGIAFGLFMAGFSGHAVIPSLARDMADPSQFDRVINWAFAVATFIYTLIGWTGYCMFGKDVSEEFSMDLLRTPGYNAQLNLACLWMLVISPFTKFALTTQPLNTTIEYLVGIDSQLLHAPEGSGSKTNKVNPFEISTHTIKRVFAVLQRIVITSLSVMVAIAVPEFSAIMAFLGSFSAFMLCIIGPISAKVALEGRCKPFDVVAVLIASIMAIWGTWAAFVGAD